MTSPTPLHFVHGSYGAIAQGHVTEQAPQQEFTLAVKEGQTLIVTFTGAGPMRGSLIGLDGQDVAGPFYGNGDTYVFPASGTYTVSTGANTMAGVWKGGFTLAVLVTNPTATPE